MGRRKKAAPDAPSGGATRALKWIGAVTAVISLLLGGRQLATWVGDTLHRRREASVQIELARQQASHSAFTDAWASLERAHALQPGEQVEAARVAVAFAWLEEARPGPGRPFSDITDAVTPTLDRALLNATGRRRADLLAHLGWAAFLRSRDGGAGNPAARYQEALAIDPSNVYANAMLGHWLMWTGSNVEDARQRFAAALSSAGDKRPFVRRLQIASLTNRGDAADAELLRVADDMRQRGEPLDPTVANRLYGIFTFRFGSRAMRSNDDLAIAPANLAATYDWVVKTSPTARESAQVAAIRERLRNSPSR